jgi:hypothetical protein
MSVVRGVRAHGMERAENEQSRKSLSGGSMGGRDGRRGEREGCLFDLLVFRLFRCFAVLRPVGRADVRSKE